MTNHFSSLARGDGNLVKNCGLEVEYPTHRDEAAMNGARDCEERGTRWLAGEKMDVADGCAIG